MFASFSYMLAIISEVMFSIDSSAKLRTPTPYSNMILEQVVMRTRLTSVLYVVILAVVFAQEDPSLPELPPGHCTVPDHFIGEYFSIEVGQEKFTTIDSDSMRNGDLNGVCYERQDLNETDSLSGAPARGVWDSNIVFYDVFSDCYSCYIFVWRTPGVIQYKYSECLTDLDGEDTLDDLCGTIRTRADYYTYFNTGRREVNCINTFEGSYNFTYEFDEGGGGVCQSPQNFLEACQEPGSMYVDNTRFKMNFGKCEGIATSMNKFYDFHCLGSWEDDTGNMWAAILDRGEDEERFRYRCMLTRLDQELPLNRLRYTMSLWADCSTLDNPYEGPMRLLLEPVVSTTEMPVVEPMCNFPIDYTGHWFHVGEYDVKVDINTTHLYFKTIIDQFTYKEAYYMCIMNTGTRYLTLVQTVGKCEVDFVCYDMLPRKHSLIRWRIGKPYRLTAMDMARPDYLAYIFEQSCWWSSFTIDREDYTWMYNVFILNPPSPVKCPIRGRYHYVQEGEDDETISNDEVTETPRHQVGCKDIRQVWHTCDKRPSLIELDEHYCETLDHIGRPIGEFDCSDNELTCIGYYQEDFKFFLYTWNIEDQASTFRCWNYERLDWRHVALTMSASGRCFPQQTAHSHWKDHGISLKYTLTEAERLFDDCPTRYLDGTEYSENEEVLLNDRQYERYGNFSTRVIMSLYCILCCLMICYKLLP